MEEVLGYREENFRKGPLENIPIVPADLFLVKPLRNKIDT